MKFTKETYYSFDLWCLSSLIWSRWSIRNEGAVEYLAQEKLFTAQTKQTTDRPNIKKERNQKHRTLTYNQLTFVPKFTTIKWSYLCNLPL